MIFRRRAVVFRWRAVVGRICPAQKRSPRQRPPDTAHERKDLPRVESPPRRRPPDTAHERKDLPRAETLPRRKPPDTAHEQKNLPRGGSRSPHVPTNGGPPPTDEQPEKHPFGGVAPEMAHGRKDLPAQKRSPRRRPPETAHERKDLPRPGTLSSAKASRHGARAKGFAPRRNTPLGEGFPTRRTRERVCPARERSPRRRPPDTAHERKDLPRA